MTTKRLLIPASLGLAASVALGATWLQAAGPAIRVTSPNTAVSWAAETTRTITWTHNLGTAAFVDIEVSRDGGTTWETVAASVQNDAAATGSYSWAVSGPPTNTARVRVTSSDTPAATDTSDVPFAIVAPAVTVTSPNGAGSVQIGSTRPITFTHNLGAGQPVNLEVSRDSGATWSPIASVNSSAATSGNFAWVATGPATAHARLRVSWAADPAASDMSDVDFTLAGPTLTVTSPNGSGKVQAGTPRAITFTHNLGVGQQVQLAVSRDGGATWSAIQTTTTTSATSGSVQWLVSGPATAEARVRASRVADPATFDISDVNFTIVVPPQPTTVHINEVESNGGVPGDWVELVNTGASPADLSGWRVLDNDDGHVPLVLPANTIVAPGGYLLVEEAALGFGLGAADSVRLYDVTGTLFESYSWTAHATTTYGRCPNGTGAFITTTSSTKGAANDCSVPPVTTVHINEVESSGGVPGDWVELVNVGAAAADISGWRVIDNDDAHTALVLPPNTVVAAGGYLVVEEAALGFGLGSADSVRLFNASGALFESYSWTAHATTSYGRCPNGTGAFVTTTSVTKGVVNACPGDAQPWPGDQLVQTIDGTSVFAGNMSGLAYEASATPPLPGVLWAVRNGPGTLFRLVFNGTIWTPDPANAWSAGKALKYPNGTGNPDAEGVTFADAGSAAGIYVSAERNNDANSISRNSILRFDPGAAGSTLVATHEWNLTADLPAVGANLGMEAITWIPDAFLVSRGFVDVNKGPSIVYNPADYPNHGTGLFFVGLEANGLIYAYALDHVTGAFTRIATIATGFAGVMDLQFDRDLNDFWAVCDDTCQGQSAVLRIAPGSGVFSVSHLFARPTSMPNLNNEGFAFAPLVECVGNRRPVYWSDDGETGGHAIRAGTLTCTPF